LAVVALNVQLILLAQRRLARALPAGVPSPLHFEASFPKAAAGLRKARHWTPS